VAEFLHRKFHITIVYKFVQHFAHTSTVKAILIESSSILTLVAATTIIIAWL